MFSEQPGEKPDMNSPFTVRIGATVPDFAEEVHQDFSPQFKSARVWGSARLDGQLVERDHILKDGDIVELTIR